MFKDKYNLPDEFPILQDVYPNNLLDETFGMWPDNMVALKDGKLIYRGVIKLDGSRDRSHSKYLEEHMDRFKY